MVKLNLSVDILNPFSYSNFNQTVIIDIFNLDFSPNVAAYIINTLQIFYM